MTVPDFVVYSMWFLSSYLPLYVFVLILRWSDFQYVTNNAYCATLLGVIIGLILISIFTIVVFAKIETGNNIRLKPELTPADENIMSYAFTYILPLAGAVPSTSIELIVVNILLFFMMWVLYVKMRLLYVNPILIMLGYRVYKMGAQYIITNIPINYLIKNTGNVLSVYFITNNIVIAKKKFNDDIG